MKKFYVRIFRKDKNEVESWQTLGPYWHEFAEELMLCYLILGECCWIEEVDEV